MHNRLAAQYLQFLVSEVTAEHIIITMFASQGGKSPGTHRGSNWVIISEQDILSIPILHHLFSCRQSITCCAFARLIFPVTYLDSNAPLGLISDDCLDKSGKALHQASTCSVTQLFCMRQQAFEVRCMRKLQSMLTSSRHVMQQGKQSQITKWNAADIALE